MADVDVVANAYRALVAGDSGPLVSLIDPTMEWRGAGRRRFLRMRYPSWHGPDEARSVLEGQRRSMEARHVSAVTSSVVASSHNQVLIELAWPEPTRGDQVVRLWQRLTLRDGRIVDIQDYRNRGRALKSMG